MVSPYGNRAMANKKRDEKSVKIDRGLAVKAKLIAETRGQTIGQYLSAYLRGPIERDWPKAVRDVSSNQAENPNE